MTVQRIIRGSGRSVFQIYLFMFLTTGNCLAPSIFFNGQSSTQFTPPPPVPLEPESIPKMGALPLVYQTYPLAIVIPSSISPDPIEVISEVQDPEVVPLLAFQQLRITTENDTDLQIPQFPQLVSEDDLDACNTTVLELFQTIDNIDLFESALKGSSLESLFNNSKLTTTIFVPVDSAFQALLDQIALPFDEFIARTEILISFLQLHVIPEESLFLSNITVGNTYDTLLNDQSVEIGLELPENLVTVLSPISAPPAVIIESDLRACNSIVHLIDNVLIPDLSDILISGQSGQ